MQTPFSNQIHKGVNRYKIVKSVIAHKLTARLLSPRVHGLLSDDLTFTFLKYLEKTTHSAL